VTSDDKATPTRDEATVANASADDSRDFARGLGYLLQGFGAALLLLMTCTCAGVAFIEAGVWQTSGDAELAVNDGESMAKSEDANGLSEGEQVAALRRKANAAMLVGSALGAFCLVGFGLGMQADRGWKPAAAAGVTCAVMFAGYGWAAWTAWTVDSAWWSVTFAVILCVVSLILAIFSFGALGSIVRNPPAKVSAPTVPAAVFPDPWAKSRSAESSYDEPLKESIGKQRDALRKQLEDLEELERRLGGSDSEGGRGSMRIGDEVYPK